ncbi:MAG: ABC transporter permease, partial [Actinobacteria bacterium]|nr:ABC transporter permease [Actinomycetota bacterium]
MSSRWVALWRSRGMIALLVNRDLRVRYSTSVLGYIWTILDPLLSALVYWFVFTVIFVRSGVGESPYIVFLLAGLLPWTWATSSIQECTRALTAEAKLVRSSNIPREVWVLRVVFSKFMEFLFSL